MWSRFYDGEEWRLAKTGRIGDQEYWRRLLEPLGLNTPASRHAWVQRLFRPFEHVHPRMRDLLEQLRRHYRLALLSNASDWLATALKDEFRLDGVFDVVVISALVGMAKPDPAIYELALERLGLPAAATLFIDDQARNTRAAEALGIPSLVFPGVAGLWAELRSRGILDAANPL
jgi:HAD superfamily hydrolase (TIGR01509 family)